MPKTEQIVSLPSVQLKFYACSVLTHSSGHFTNLGTLKQVLSEKANVRHGWNTIKTINTCFTGNGNHFDNISAISWPFFLIQDSSFELRCRAIHWHHSCKG